MKYLLGLDCNTNSDSHDALILRAADDKSLYDYFTPTDRLNFEPTDHVLMSSDTVAYFPASAARTLAMSWLKPRE